VEGGDDRQKLNKSRDGMAGNKSKVMLKFQMTDTRLDLSGCAIVIVNLLNQVFEARKEKSKSVQLSMDHSGRCDVNVTLNISLRKCRKRIHCCIPSGN